MIRTYEISLSPASLFPQRTEVLVKQRDLLTLLEAMSKTKRNKLLQPPPDDHYQQYRFRRITGEREPRRRDKEQGRDRREGSSIHSPGGALSRFLCRTRPAQYARAAIATSPPPHPRPGSPSPDGKSWSDGV
jgi:hypothetical protein